jgi:hypothetical protein
MPEEQIPDAIREFIARHIDSVGQLEALLLLRGNPDERWNAAQVASRLYISDREAQELLARLCEHGFIACDADVYRYACKSADQQAMVDDLAAFYARHLIPVTNMIHAKTRRIREFANAFRVRKDR